MHRAIVNLAAMATLQLPSRMKDRGRFFGDRTEEAPCASVWGGLNCKMISESRPGVCADWRLIWLISAQKEGGRGG